VVYQGRMHFQVFGFGQRGVTVKSGEFKETVFFFFFFFGFGKWGNTVKSGGFRDTNFISRNI